LAGGINLYVYVGGDPVNAIDPWGLITAVETRPWGNKRGGFSSSNVEGHLVVGGGVTRTKCCDGKDFVVVTVVKVCMGVAIGGSGTVTKSSPRCNNIKVGDFSIGPEAGVSFGPGTVEGALTFSGKNGASPSGGFGLGFGIKGKLTVCTYWVTGKEKIGCCSE
jgi:hypothetical protein